MYLASVNSLIAAPGSPDDPAHTRAHAPPASVALGPIGGRPEVLRQPPDLKPGRWARASRRPRHQAGSVRSDSDCRQVLVERGDLLGVFVDGPEPDLSPGDLDEQHAVVGVDVLAVGPGRVVGEVHADCRVPRGSLDEDLVGLDLEAGAGEPGVPALEVLLAVQIGRPGALTWELEVPVVGPH